jgi:hypothetical protein
MTSLQTALIRLGSRPLAIAPRALEALLAAGHVALAPRSSGTTLGRGYAVTDAGIAVVPVLGPLVARGDWLTELFGASVYGELGEAIETALAEMTATLVVPPYRRSATTQLPARRTTMTHPVEPDDAPETEAQHEPPQEASETLPTEPTPAPPEPAPAPPDEATRAAAAEIAEVAAQAARLGVAVDAADAIRRGISAYALRRSVLDALAARAEASAIVIAKSNPASDGTSESPIVRRARERAAAAQH